MLKSKDNWFVDWFDSDHYHLLYNHRDFNEAEQFISTLFNYLKLKPTTKVLDLACGKGRHAIQVHELGYDVLGVDLSEESIDFAKQFEEKGLQFRRADMRDLRMHKEVDLVLNLFTSFGYFRVEGENKKVLESISKALNDNGVLLLDYLNVSKVIKSLPKEELIKRDHINFKVSKKHEENFIVKNIEFEDKGIQHNFQEYVKQIDLPLFKAYFDEVGMEIVETFGDYKLNPFSESNSDRLIMLVKKKSN